MPAREAAETKEAIRLFQTGIMPREAAQRAGIAYNTLLRALQRKLQRLDPVPIRGKKR